MQTLSTNQKQHLVNAGKVGVTITVDPVQGEQFTVTTPDIVQGSFSIERNWAHGSTLEIGCADTSELIFALRNHDGQWSDIRWEGARLTVTLDIAGQPLQAGIFTVDERPGRLTTMEIRALDDMARFNRLYNTDLVYPATLLQIIQDACAKCNVTLHSLSFTNSNYTVQERPAGDDITYHHIVAWVAELAGCNAWIDHLGRLQLSWYGDNQSEVLEIGPIGRFNYEVAEADVTITGIIQRTEETDYLVGSEDYALVIEGNPLLQSNHAAVLQAIYNKIDGFTYRPFEFSVLGRPHLWPGDVITHLVDADGNQLTSIITNHSYTLNGKSELAAKGETETVRGYATGAPFTSSQKRVLQSIAKVETARQLSGFEQGALQFNQLMANALGYFETVVTMESGAKITYLHNQPELENSQYIWKYSAEGYGWTDQGWQGGNPDWQGGVFADSSMVIRTISAIGIKAEWIDVDDLSAITGQFSELSASIGDAVTSISGDYLQIVDYSVGWSVALVNTGGFRFETQGFQGNRYSELTADYLASVLKMGWRTPQGVETDVLSLWVGQWDNPSYGAGLLSVTPFLFDSTEVALTGDLNVGGVLTIGGGSHNVGSIIVGGVSNGSIRVRHIQGKGATDANMGPLWINQYNADNVTICGGGGQLLVNGSGLSVAAGLTVGGGLTVAGELSVGSVAFGNGAHPNHGSLVFLPDTGTGIRLRRGGSGNLPPKIRFSNYDTWHMDIYCAGSAVFFGTTTNNTFTTTGSNSMEIWSDRVVVNGNLQVDGRMTGSAIVGAAQLRIATGSSSGTLTAGASILITMHNLSFFPNISTNDNVFCQLYPSLSTPTDQIGRFVIRNNHGSLSRTYSVRWSYMASTNPLVTLLLVDLHTGEICHAVMDGGGMEYWIDEHRRSYREMMAENEALLLVEPTIEELAAVLADVPNLGLGSAEDITEMLYHNDQARVDASTLIANLRYIDGFLQAKISN